MVKLWETLQSTLFRVIPTKGKESRSIYTQFLRVIGRRLAPRALFLWHSCPALMRAVGLHSSRQRDALPGRLLEVHRNVQKSGVWRCRQSPKSVYGTWAWMWEPRLELQALKIQTLPSKVPGTVMARTWVLHLGNHWPLNLNLYPFSTQNFDLPVPKGVGCSPVLLRSSDHLKPK
jgi:hypothetical protein